jgi:ribosomal protein S7
METDDFLGRPAAPREFKIADKNTDAMYGIAPKKKSTKILGPHEVDDDEVMTQALRDFEKIVEDTKDDKAAFLLGMLRWNGPEPRLLDFVNNVRAKKGLDSVPETTPEKVFIYESEEEMVNSDEDYFDKSGNYNRSVAVTQTAARRKKHPSYFNYQLVNRLMYRGKKHKAMNLVENSVSMLRSEHGLLNPEIVFEESLTELLPIIMPKAVSVNRVKKKSDLTFLNEHQAKSMVTKWVSESIRNSNNNGPKKSSRNLAEEIKNISVEKPTYMSKKRDALYNDVWSMYNLDDEQSI